MDIIILALNSKYIHSSLAPWYLKSEIEDFDASVLEHTVNEDIETVALDVLSRRPKILAVSVYIWNVGFAYKLAKRIKEVSKNTCIIFGGPEVSYNSAEVLNICNAVDYVICGEGEEPFRNLCNYLLCGEEFPDKGVSSREKLAMPYIGIGTPKSPYTEEYFTMLNGRISYFESSRGCPYSCAYCLSGRQEGVRFFDMQYVKENLIKLAQSGTKTIKFVDRTFNANRRRALEILSFIIENSGKAFPDDVCVHFELSGDLLDDETIALLKSAPEGLFQFEVGIQSFNFETIKAIHRKTDNATLRHRISQLVELGNAHIHTDLIAGLPYENYDSFVDSFNQAYELGADMLQLGFLKILHGTELEYRATEYGFAYSNEPPYEVYETPWLSRDEILMLKITENAVDRLHNSGRFRRMLALCLPRFDSAYHFFFECGNVIRNIRGLDDMTDAIYLFLCKRLPHMIEEIRDAMVCDRLATNSSKGLPKSLYRADSRFLEIKKRLNFDEHTAEKPNVRRSIAILYHSDRAVYADYDKKNNRGEYLLGYINL
ncbi:MAG: DUF4080 domain-containing protein [Clostridia bacterium]|nr:DUF4080 domain-containing protein [Clostridia bacterium]